MLGKVCCAGVCAAAGEVAGGGGPWQLQQQLQEPVGRTAHSAEDSSWVGIMQVLCWCADEAGNSMKGFLALWSNCCQPVCSSQVETSLTSL